MSNNTKKQPSVVSEGASDPLSVANGKTGNPTEAGTNPALASVSGASTVVEPPMSPISSASVINTTQTVISDSNGQSATSSTSNTVAPGANTGFRTAPVPSAAKAVPETAPVAAKAAPETAPVVAKAAGAKAAPETVPVVPKAAGAKAAPETAPVAPKAVGAKAAPETIPVAPKAVGAKAAPETAPVVAKAAGAKAAPETAPVVAKAAGAKAEPKKPEGLTGTIPITIFGEVFNLGFSELDNLRRRTYFRGGVTGDPRLTGEEQRLLDRLQITKPLETRFRQYIADFFENLQSCNSDTSIFLRNKCQSTQLLLWNLHFAKNRPQRGPLAPPYSAEQAAMNSALLRNLHKQTDSGVGGTAGTGGMARVPSSGLSEEECLKRLFLLKNIETEKQENTGPQLGGKGVVGGIGGKSGVGGIGGAIGEGIGGKGGVGGTGGAIGDKGGVESGGKGGLGGVTQSVQTQALSENECLKRLFTLKSM